MTSCKLKISIIIIQIRRFFNLDPCYLNLKAMKFQPNVHIFLYTGYRSRVIDKRVLSIKVSSDKILWGKWNRGNISLKRIRNAIKTVK